MRKFIPTLALAGTLALATWCDAGVRPPTKALTRSARATMAIEQLCKTLGSWAYTLAESRDAGMSYDATLALYRRITAANPPTNHLEASMSASILDNMRLVYDTPSITPEGNRQATERMCVPAIEKYVQDNPSIIMAPGRY